MPKATAHVTGATGVLIRSDGVLSCYRAGAGIYHVIFPAGFDTPASEHHIDVQPLNAAARTAVLGDVGGQVPPGGANAPAGATSVQVLIFDAAGAAADSDFLFEATRI